MDKKDPISTIAEAVNEVSESIQSFMKLESTGGILLLVTTIIAIIIANSPLLMHYNIFLETKVAIQVGSFAINKPLLLWINDGLMAIFFFLIGLEIKREFLEGELASFSQIVLPGLGALGGMIVPAGIYAWLNWNNPETLNGWAIPVATDIAFALALLSSFGKRVPTALKVFLLTLAIFDDLAAIIIIALFYSANLSYNALIFAAAIFGLAIMLNKLGVKQTSTYILLGIILWIAVLKSGIHATIAGVLIAFCIPMRDNTGTPILEKLKHELHSPVAYAILPIFAFANAGIQLMDISFEALLSPITTGVTFGLLLGKPIGIMAFAGLAIILGIAKLPKDVNWPQLLGVACACGIGFTMSLFIAGLAFENDTGHNIIGDRIGIMIGSIASAIFAYIILQLTLPKQEKT